MSGQTDNDGEEETAQATMASVEEMLEGYEWASDDIIGQSIVKGTADLIEARLLDELMALEKAGFLTSMFSLFYLRLIFLFRQMCTLSLSQTIE
jgi:hypothetical protein